MKLTDHKTAAVFRRYVITNEADLREAVTKLAASLGHTSGIFRGSSSREAG